MPYPQIVDLSHDDCYNPSTKQDTLQFSVLKLSGVQGVILKATQGSSFVDPTFYERYARAITVFGVENVHAYHFLDGTPASDQMDHFLDVTKGVKFLWLDYEQNNPSQCSLDIAVLSCHLIQDSLNYWPGMYGSDKDLLGSAIDESHFVSVCPLWLASYTVNEPEHLGVCDLWQFSENLNIHGTTYDASCFLRGRDISWFGSLGS